MAKLKVMVAEDDLTMVNLLKTLLKMEGFDVVALNPDDDIVKAVSDRCPDVLLMDVHLSRQNGLEILDSIQKSVMQCDTRVIMTSGLNVKDECLAHGADGFILKPFMPDDLISMLKGA
ncbi:MAG TPA: response regulator [Anaerolineales bacterium]|nr:response regulator [Anaerolineales bacterium]